MAISNDSLYELNPTTGECRRLFALPESLTAIAVSPSDVVHGVSSETRFGEPRLYTFNSDGTVASVKPLSGAASAAGIDFGPDGTLYGLGFVNFFSLFTIDVPTGRVSVLSTGINATGDIDIDSTGTLRTFWFGELETYILASRFRVSSRVLETGNFFNALVTAPRPSLAAVRRESPVSATANAFTVWGGTPYTGPASLSVDRNENTAWTLNGVGSIRFELSESKRIVGVRLNSIGHVSNGNVVNVLVDNQPVARNVSFGGLQREIVLPYEVSGRTVTIETVRLPHNEFAQIATWSEIGEFTVLVRD